MATAVKFLYEPSLLADFDQVGSADSFVQLLNVQTDRLRVLLPSEQRTDGSIRGGHWGSARKFLNIFLFECTLNRYLCESYENIPSLEPWLEVPLDSYVGNGLVGEPENRAARDPLRWETIIGLDKDVSDRIQGIAQVVATRMKIYRVHLDLYYLRYPDTVTP
jgi:hypothetical protein